MHEEIKKLEELCGFSLPTTVKDWLLQVEKSVSSIMITRDGRTRELKCGFKVMYNHYNKIRRNERRARQNEFSKNLIYFGNYIDAQDLGYFYVDPQDPDLVIKQFSTYGEYIDDLGKFVSVVS